MIVGYADTPQKTPSTLKTTKKTTRSGTAPSVTPDKTIPPLTVGNADIARLTYSSNEESTKDPNEVQVVGSRSVVRTPTTTTRPPTTHSTTAASTETAINNILEQPETQPSMSQMAIQPYSAATASSKSNAIVVHQPMLRLQREPYMATRVRKEATDTIFRAVKFMNTENLVRTTLRRLSELMNIEEDLRYEWELVYRKDLVFAINNKRNSVAQGCKTKLKGTYMLGGLLSMTVVLTLCCCCCCYCCCSAARG